MLEIGGLCGCRPVSMEEVEWDDIGDVIEAI